jgi:hypothetical protein
MTDFRFPASFTRGARMLRELQHTGPGQHFRMMTRDLCDIEVPAHPLDRQTPEYLAKWMHARAPFYCTLHADPLGQWWEIRRPAVVTGEGPSTRAGRSA